MIDKNAGAEREVIGKKKTPNGRDYPSVEFDDNNVQVILVEVQEI